MILNRFAAALAVIFAATPVSAEDVPAPVLPGIGAHDPRIRTDPNDAPWRGVGKLQASTGDLHASCTGTLIGPATVLTAAHCVFNPQTGRNFAPESLHFLIGYHGGDYAGHGIGVRLTIGPGYDPRRSQQTMGSDWALLTIDSRLGTQGRVLALQDRPPPAGTDIMIGGYPQDHPLMLTIDPHCRITGQAVDGGGRPLLVDNCAATRGVSGAPVLIAIGKNWRIGGIYVAASTDGQMGIVVPLTEMLAQLGRAQN